MASPESLTAFEAVSLTHTCVHLSLDFERALEKGMYDAAQSSDVAEYIRLLRSPPREVVTRPQGRHFVIPMPPSSSDLILRIKKLQDPRKMAPNQPRDRYRDPLDFTTTGAGVQCDINFSAHLALHNTALLRCYSHTDPEGEADGAVHKALGQGTGNQFGIPRYYEQLRLRVDGAALPRQCCTAVCVPQSAAACTATSSGPLTC